MMLSDRIYLLTNAFLSDIISSVLLEIRKRKKEMFIFNIAEQLLSNVAATYIDPSAVSTLLVSISTVAIALGAAVVIFVRRAKKKVTKALHIDENANKEVEDEIVIKEDEE